MLYLSIVNRYCLFLLIPLFIAGFFLLGSKLAYCDSTPPETISVLDPAGPDGDNGWYVNPVAVTLDASDLESGIKEINWKIGDRTWQKRTFTQTLNMMLNSSFEEDTNGWSFFGALGSEGQRTSLESKDGSYSVSIISSQGGVSYWANKPSYVIVSPWETISLGVWMKGDNILGNGSYIKVYVITSEGDQLLYTSSPRAGTFDWVYESKDLVIASDSAYGLYLELVLDGTGTIYFDSVYAAYASEAPQVEFVVSDNGFIELRYYSVDFAGNQEAEKLAAFKTDTLAPMNWRNFETERAGNAHTLISRIDVSDNTSGLSSSNSEFQYSVLDEYFWGYFDDYGDCRGEFNWGGWLGLSSIFVGGDLTGTLVTPVVNYCNSNWLICKAIRFKVSDMAGNEATKEICINGTWVKVVGGDVASLDHINMTSGAEDNTDGVIASHGSISNFTSSNGWYLYDYPGNNNYSYYDYNYLKDTLLPSETVDKLPVESGIYITGGNFYITSSSIPSDYNSKVFTNVLFVNGNLVISDSFVMNEASGTVFVVKGDVLINKSVDTVYGFFLVDGKFDTSYNGGLANDNVTIYGGVRADYFDLSRSLKNSNNGGVPSERFIYDPKYLIDFVPIFGKVIVRWVEMGDL